MKRRAISLILALAMLISLLPAITVQSEAEYDEGWLWPIKTQKSVDSCFGMRDLNGNGKFDNPHSGIDIFCAMGTEVRATRSGTIISVCYDYPAWSSNPDSMAGGMKSYGNHIIVKNDNNTYTIYAHLNQTRADEIAVNKPVSQGQKIAFTGKSGCAYGAHLHFECTKSAHWGAGYDLINTMPTQECMDSLGIWQRNPYVPASGYPTERMTYKMEVTPPFEHNGEYPCAVKITTKTACNFWSMPGSTSTYPESENLGKIPAGTTLTSTCIYRNTVTTSKHFWYEIRYNNESEPAYVYSENVAASESSLLWPSVKGASVPETITTASFDVNGTLTSPGQIITTVEGHVFKGNTGTSTTGTDAITKSSLTGQSLKSLNLKGSAIDTGLKFQNLTNNKWYTLSIIATSTNYYVNSSNELKTVSKPKCAGHWYFYKGTTPTYYTVTLNPGAGTCSPTTIKYTKGDTLGNLPQAELDGYYFDGWYSESGVEAAETMQVNSNMTLFAHYMSENTYAAKINFDPNGGTLNGIVKTGTASGYNRDRGTAELIVYNKAGTQPNTNEYGYEVAVDASGHVTAKRAYGSTTKLTVPNGGFILSGHTGWNDSGSYGGGPFVNSIIALSDAYVRVNYETGKVYVYDSYDSYLADGTYLWEYAWFEELPIPKWEDHFFAGWYNVSYTTNRIVYHSGFGGSNCVARWDSSPYPIAEMSWNGHFYQVYDYNMSWTEAKALCESLGGHLVTITSQAEQNQIMALTQQCDMGQYYIGATDAETEGTWKWVTGEAFSFTNWDLAYPEPNGGTDENYVTMVNKENPPNKEPGEWVDCKNMARGSGFYDCSNTGFICEYERPSLCEHTYQYSVTVEPTLSAGGWITGRCSQCGDSTTTVLPILNKTDYQYSRVKDPTCAEYGKDQYKWSNSSSGTFTFFVQIDKTPHQYQSVTTPPSCASYGYTTYICIVCGDAYVVYQNSEWSEWSEVFPAGIDPSMVESKTQYRYADYETVQSTEPSLSGYDQISSTWIETDSGVITYASSWPSGFDKTHSLYDQYNKTPKAASETQTTKVVVSSETAGYIYYHWCRGTYTGGPINRLTSQTKTSEFKAFHAFFDTRSASRYDNNGTDGNPSRYFPNGSICKDSYWYYPITVNRQTYTEYQKEFTYGRWGSWSDWSDTAVTANDTRQVETRALYRYATAPSGTHSWDNGVITTTVSCTEDGVKTFTCTACGETRTEILVSKGHQYQKTTVAPSCTAEGYIKYVCTVCGHTYNDNVVSPKGHTWDNGVVSTQPGPGTVGVRTFTCSVCGATRTETIAALPVTYTVTYYANGGDNAPNAQTKTEDVALTLSDYVPTRAGHTFLGWAESSTATSAAYAPGATFTENRNLSLYAVWKIHTFTVSYDANGGTGAPAAQTKTYGQALTLRSEAPTKTGHDFLGWAETSDAQEAQYPSGGSYQTDSVVVLYAVWTPSEYTVTFNPNGGTVDPVSRSISFGEQYGVLPTPTRTGYSFEGWYTGNNSGEEVTSTTTFFQTTPVTLYAKWIINVYTITYNTNGGSPKPSDQQKTYGIPVSLSSTKPKKDGYLFIGWAISEIGEPVYQPGGTYSEEHAISLFAAWQPEQYLISFDANGGTAPPEALIKNYDEAVTIPEDQPIWAGHTFLGWADSADAVVPQYYVGDSITLNQDVLLYAVWEEIPGYIPPYTVSFDTNGGLPLLDSIEQEGGTPIVIPDIEVVKENAVFLGWSTEQNAASPDYTGGDSFITDQTSVTLFAVWGNMDSTVAAGSVGDNVTWTLYEGGLFVMSGNGETAEISKADNIPWYTNYRESIINVIIEPGITVLRGCTSTSHGLFYNCTNLTYVSLPESLTTIGKGTFYICPNLKKVTIPESVVEIGDRAFSGCSSLRSIVLPDSVSHLGIYAFMNCNSLSTAVLSSNLSEIQHGTFEFTAFESIIIPDSVTQIGDYAFAWSQVSTIEFGQNIQTIGKQAFIETHIHDLMLPGNLQSIGERAFEKALSDPIIIFPDTVATIGDKAFYGNANVEQYYLSTSLSSLGLNAFGMNSCLQAIITPDENEYYSSQNGLLFDKNSTKLIFVPEKAVEHLTVPDTVTEIGPYAFYGNNNILTVDLPDTIETIGDYAFAECKKLNSIQLPIGLTTLGQSSFYNCSSLSGKIIIPPGIETLAYETFYYCVNLNEVEFSEGLKTINSRAFYNCDSLQEVILPDGVEQIKSTAFFSCSIKKLRLPETLKVIGAMAFAYNIRLALVTLPESLESIEGSAFYHCYNLQNIVYPSKLTSISTILRENNMKTMVIPINVKNVKEAFGTCKDLYYEGTETDWEQVTGYNTLSYTNIHYGYDGLTVKVTLKGNGGSPVTQKIDLTYGEPYGDLPEIERMNYSFVGWFTEAEDGEQIFPDSIVANLRNHTIFAQWKPIEYAITYDPNGGTGDIATQMKVHGIDLQLTDTIPHRPGFSFLGWTTAAYETEVFYSPGSLYTDNSETTLYAVWSPNQYTIQFDCDGGEVSPNTKKVLFGSSYGELPIPLWAGHSFDGWFLEDGTQITAESQVEIAANHTLTAHWTVETYPVTYDANGGVSAPDAEVKTYGVPLTISSQVPVRTGYQFLGWATSADSTSAVYQPGAAYTGNSALSLYAVWKVIPYKVTLQFNDGATPTQQRTLTYGAPYGQLPTPEKAGYEFGGWYHENGEVITAETLMLTTANHTLTAKWNAKEWTVSFDANNGANEPEQITVKTDEEFTIPEAVPVNAGHRFLGWAQSADSNTPEYQPGDSLQVRYDVTLYALWQAEHYTVTFDARGGELAFTSKSVLFGQPYGELPIPTMEDNEFLGWYTDIEEGTVITAEDPVQITEDQTFYARWAIDTHLLRFDANNGHTESSTKRFAVGEVLGVLPEAQKDGNQFAGWYTAPEDGQEMNEGEEFIYKEDADLYAHWSPEEYTIRYDLGDQAQRTPDQTQTKYYGTDITLSDGVPEREGYVFTGWALSPFADRAEYSDGDTFTLNRNATLYPVWAEKAPIVFTQMPEDVTALPGETARFSVAAQGNGLSYRWEYSTDGGWSWAELEAGDAAAIQISIVMQAEKDGTLFRCAVTDAEQNAAISDYAKLQLPACEAVIVAQPQDFAGHMGEAAEFTVEAEGDHLTYHWHYSTDAGETWADTESQTPTIGTVLTEETYGRLYRCEIVDQFGISLFSDSAILGLASSDIIIVEQPESIFGEAGESYTFHVAAEAENLTYQWYYSVDLGDTWEVWPEAGSDSDTISFAMTEENQHYIFRCFLESGRQIAAFSDVAGVVGYGINQPGDDPFNPFTDVKEGKYYYDAVLWAYFHDPQITSGTSETTFSPNATCTRAQIVTFLWRAAGSPEPTTTNNPFTDVKDSKYYYKAVLWAAETGVTSGTSETTFSPNNGCTRAQVVTFLWRFADSPEPTTTTNPFTDVPAGKYYTKAVLWAAETGVTAGTSETTFSPKQTCTRGQIVTFLYRYMVG